MLMSSIDMLPLEHAYDHVLRERERERDLTR
jgi:hypothetical protein